MELIDTVDRTIRNRRFNRWEKTYWFLSLGTVYLGVSIWMGITLPPFAFRWVEILVAATFLVLFLLIRSKIGGDTCPRIKLGEDLHADSFGRFMPDVIREISYSTDPQEDYAENELPIVLCQICIVPKRGRGLSMLVSKGDAVHLREWAECKSIAVLDPYDFSKHLSERS